MSEHEDRTPVVREFPVEFAETGDGRTIEARIVPYNTVARVADPPDYTPYEERWLPGVFDKQARAANRVSVLLNFEHEQGIKGVVGHGIELDSRADGLYGTFRIHRNVDGDKTLELVNEGVLTGLSVEAVPLASRRVDGVVDRVRAHLDKVALCRTPAFKDAMVLAVREGDPDPDDEPAPDDPEDEPAPVAQPEPEPELVPAAARSVADEMLERVGYQALVKRAVVNKPWDGSPARFSDEEYQRSCLIDRGGEQPPKARCSLPVLEPNGDLNVNALGPAAGGLAGARGGVGDVTSAMRAAAARKLVRYYRQAGRSAPPAVVSLAAR